MKTNKLAEIHAMIQQDLAVSRQLLALLEKETQSTQSRDYISLSELLEAKAPLLEQLQQNAQTRSDWLQTLQQPTDNTGWSELLASLNNTELEQQWQETKTTIEQCQRINEINGKLINRGIASHSRLLQIMRGNIEQNGLYDASGNQQGSRLSGTVAQA